MTEMHVNVEAPALLGVLADTHSYPNARRRGLEQVMDLLRRARVDHILHAGDVGDPQVLEELREIAPVFAVRGNADPRELIEALPDRVRIAVGDHVVLLMHGHRGKTARSAAKAAAEPGIDLIVFGHSHKPLIEQEGETVLLGLVRVSAAAIDPELVLFADPRDLVNVTF
jgi:putative phosphoesterase